MNDFKLQINLEDERVSLRPLEPQDFDALFAVAADPAIWAQHPAKDRSEPEGFRIFFQQALEGKSAFVILDQASGNIIGSSRYHPCPDTPLAIEIGWTFLATAYWGGSYNQAVKKLMINHAFQHYDWVLFHIHRDNLRSRKAVEKIGARPIHTLEGKTITTRSAATLVYGIRKEPKYHPHHPT